MDRYLEDSNSRPLKKVDRKAEKKHEKAERAELI